jgi:hypothetical protein
MSGLRMRGTIFRRGVVCVRLDVIYFGIKIATRCCSAVIYSSPLYNQDVINGIIIRDPY